MIEKMMQERPIWVGVALFLITFTILFNLPDAWAMQAFATLLTLIGAIYVGFAVAQNEQIGLQFMVALGFMVLGLLGLWMSPWFMIAGYFLHGVWDWVHHDHKMPVKLTDWYAPFCFVYDWLIGAAIFVFWL